MLRNVRFFFFVGVVVVAVRLFSDTSYQEQVCDQVNVVNTVLRSEFRAARNVSILSDDIIVRAAYYDPRPRQGYPHTSVFLAEVRKSLLGKGKARVVACGSIRHNSNVLRVHAAGITHWLHHSHPEINHDPVMIDCLGLPKLLSGTRVYLWYNNGSETLHRVEAENTYFIPREKNNQTPGNPTIVVCIATLYHKPPFMKEFLRYYKHLRVDHIYMVAEDSLVMNGILQGDEVIKEALMEGFVSFSFWNIWLNSKEIFYHSQMLAYQDCIYRFQGTYDYIFHVDSDDHFIPLLPNQTHLDYYISRYCRNAGSCRFKWIEYYPDCGQDWSRLGPHGNVTNTLKSYTRVVHKDERKSIHLLDAIIDSGIHTAFQLMPSFKIKTVPRDVAYVAHLRLNRNPPEGLKC